MNETEREVESFLDAFKAKCKSFGYVMVGSRQKNYQTLLDLDIHSKTIEETLLSLQSIEYSEGPLKNHLEGAPDLWVFGREIQKKEIYIKIHKGYDNKQPVCISFHIAEHKMIYPLKNE